MIYDMYNIAYQCGERLCDREWCKAILQDEEMIEKYQARRLEYIASICKQLKVCPAENCGLVLCMEINPSTSSPSSSSAIGAGAETVTCKACGEQVPRNIENVETHICTAPSGSGVVGGSIFDVFFGGFMDGSSSGGAAVKSSGESTMKEADHVGSTSKPPPEPKTVICSNGHSFCSLCDQPAHAPTSCEDHRAWVQKIKDEISDASDENGKAMEGTDLANALWLKANTKKCPRCSALIEKDEGCNHMTCRKCRHDFCWICMQPWSLHSNTTGGYFQCNRFIEEGEEDDKNNRGDSSSGKVNIIRTL